MVFRLPVFMAGRILINADIKNLTILYRTPGQLRTVKYFFRGDSFSIKLKLQVFKEKRMFIPKIPCPPLMNSRLAVQDGKFKFYKRSIAKKMCPTEELYKVGPMIVFKPAGTE
ncbi:MAG: hypothetical protein A2464_08220 [Deltaproteobacteria bacterium RIFOXYC2_FULL_48_10]|nr:MAG: hypothetical protein A2464_08220 [Deltaproteobacteria bacterium RIFOXYC2_FULL_48_10]